MENGMKPWKFELLQKACATLGVEKFLGQVVKFEVDEPSANNCRSHGGCNRISDEVVDRKLCKHLVHPEGPILATDFFEKFVEENRFWRRELRVYVELPKSDWSTDHGHTHYLVFDGVDWKWMDECGGYPGDTYLEAHLGKLVLV